MNVNVLIDSIVRQTTVLIAQLATAAGARPSLAHTANQVFVDLVRELKDQGVTNKVIADMFGLALRTYHDRIRRLEESATYGGRSLWEAVLEFVQERGTVLQADVQQRFRNDDPLTLRGVLRDLVESGLLFRSGRGERITYRAATPEEMELPGSVDATTARCNLVWVGVHRLGPATVEQLIELIPMAQKEMESALELLSAGCEEPNYPSLDDLAALGSTEPPEDAVNLRGYRQKQRFGVDYLYPVERYSRALTSPEICPGSSSLDPAECAPDDVMPNPLFQQRSPEDVIIAGLVGVPWEDLAVDPTGDSPLVYRSASQGDSEGVNWSWLIGERSPESGLVVPADPQMLESIEPRSGQQPSTNAELSREWNIFTRDDLQFACTFDLAEPRQCLSIDEPLPGNTGGCDCTFYEDPLYNHPFCDGLTQRREGAHPALRQLQVLYDVSEQAVVASLCPKTLQDPSTPDYAYRPALNALLSRLGERRAD